MKPLFLPAPERDGGIPRTAASPRAQPTGVRHGSGAPKGRFTWPAGSEPQLLGKEEGALASREQELYLQDWANLDSASSLFPFGAGGPLARVT